MRRYCPFMNQPLTQIADVRFLGKILGDVIRAHGGDALFQRIEAIRAGSVDRYRGISNPRGLDAGLDTLTLDETVAFARSFMLFSMLANLAEDRQGVHDHDVAVRVAQYRRHQRAPVRHPNRPSNQPVAQIAQRPYLAIGHVNYIQDPFRPFPALKVGHGDRFFHLGTT